MRILILTAVALSIGVASADSKRHPAPARQVSAAVVIRGFETVSARDAASKAAALERALPELRTYGVGIHQSRVLWSTVEPQEGIYDWSGCDRLVAIYKRNGIRWSPILVAGGVDGVPAWFRRKPGFRRFTCVEHGQESPIVSRWYPALRNSSLKFVKAFCERYRESGVLESVTLGIAGNDGRAELPGGAANPTADVHLHPGLWLKDEYAVEAFQIWLAARYGGSSPLRDAWGGLTQGLGYVKPFLKRDAPTERAWVDQLDFAADSTAQWAGVWLKEARASLPNTPLYLRTSGDAPAESGVDLAAQSKAAAEFGAGLQVLLNSTDARTLLVRSMAASSCSSAYKAPLRLELEGALSGPSLTAGTYAAATSGADGIVLDHTALLASASAREALKSRRNHVTAVSRRPYIAVYYPQTHRKLIGGEIAPAIQPLRDRFDFDLICDTQILEGGLDRYRALVLVQGNVSEGKVWRDVLAWVRKGGLVVHPEGMGPLLTIERDDFYHAQLFAPRPVGKEIRAISFPLRGNSLAYRDRVVKLLSEAPELPAETREALVTDAEEDGVFLTGSGGARLWLNPTTTARQKGGIRIPPLSITASAP